MNRSSFDLEMKTAFSPQKDKKQVTKNNNHTNHHLLERVKTIVAFF